MTREKGENAESAPREIILNRMTGGPLRFALTLPPVTVCATSREDALLSLEEFLTDHAADYVKENYKREVCDGDE